MSESTYTPMVAAARFVPYRELALEVSTKDGTVRFDNPRTETGLDIESLNGLGESVRDKLRSPLTVAQIMDDAGRVHELVVDGQRRHRGMAPWVKPDQLIPVVDLYDQPMKLTEENVARLIEDALEIGQKRAGLSTFEQVTVAARLLSLNRKQAKIAKTLGRSEAWTSRMLKAWKSATPELKEALRTGKVIDEAFKELAEVRNPSDQIAALEQNLAMRARGQTGAAMSVASATAARARTSQAFAPQLADADTYKPPAPPAKDPRQKDMFEDDDIPGGAQGKAAPTSTVRGKARPEPCAACGAPPDHHTKAKARACAMALAKKARGKPSLSRVGEFAKLRAERRGAKHAYVRGMVDFAAFVTGEIGEDELGAPWKAYLKQLHKKSKGGK